MKLLASDLDGTLYFSDIDGHLKPQDVKAIKQFQQGGHLFGLCTGRTYVGINHALEGLDVRLDFYILASGSALMDSQGQYLYRQMLPKNIVSKIIDRTLHLQTNILVCHDEDYAVVSNIESIKMKGYHIKDSSELKYENYDSLHFGFADLMLLEEVKEILLTEFGEEIEVHHNVLNLDITPKGCSKGNAIQTLEKYLPVKFADIATIGDSFNDISMLKASNISFTFPNSKDEVKACATDIVQDICEAIEIMKGR